MAENGLDIFGACPKCGVSWDAGPIPEKSHQYYSPPYRYSRVIGVERPEIYDGTLYHECPDCRAQFPRFKP